MVNEGSFRGMASPHDVISLMKKHICDKELSQPPMLVLTHHRAGCLDIVPTQKLLSAIQSNDFYYGSLQRVFKLKDTEKSSSGSMAVCGSNQGLPAISVSQ